MYGRTRWLIGFGLLISFSLSAPGLADIYKYQDEHGKWHYSDKAPGAGKKAEVIGEDAREQAGFRDLRVELNEKFATGSAIERASLAVVAVKSRLSQGSGFFVSDNGYILTNKHLVKPAETKQWKDLEAKVEKQKAVYQAAKKEFEDAAEDLHQTGKDLERYESLIESTTNIYQKAVLKTEYRYLKRRHEEHLEVFRRQRHIFNERKRAFDKARSEFNWETSAAVLERRFRVYLKDDTELSARLISVSPEHDLALLKVDGCKTPSIKSASMGALSQGMKVYAIGSPLGLRDSVTSGVLTRIRDDYLLTDATVLPGSSGGPLVTEVGEVIGINTLKLGKPTSTDSLGAAIPMDTIKAEFGTKIE